MVVVAVVFDIFVVDNVDNVGDCADAGLVDVKTTTEITEEMRKININPGLLLISPTPTQPDMTTRLIRKTLRGR